MQGLVFWFQGNLSLLTTSEKGVNIQGISDDLHIYSNLPLSKADVVDIHKSNEGFKLKSIRSISFKNEDTECSAEEAIMYTLNEDPKSIMNLF